MTVNLRSSLNTGLNNGLRQSISGGVNGLGFFRAASLDLQFASKKTLNDRVSNSNLITFTRASSGTYVDGDGVIKTTPVNLVTYSEQCDQWLKTSSTVTANVIAAPNGSITADQFNRANTSSSNYIRRGASKNGSPITYTFSIYFKKDDARYVSIRLQGNYPNRADVVFDLDTGTVSKGPNAFSSFSGPSAAIVPVTDGWYRCSLTATTDSYTVATGYFSCSAENNYIDGTSTDINSVYLWGAQLEEGSTATDYIPTTSTMSGAPRFDHDPATGESLGLLIEEARTNYVPYSSDLSVGGSVWVKNGSTISLSSESAPDGSLAYKYTATLSGNNILNAGIAPTQGSVATFSFWAKNISATEAKLGVLNQNGNTWILNPASNDYISEINTSTWTRIERTFTVGNGTIAVYPVSNLLNGEEILIWGVQVEVGSFSTSYIPTSGTSVTRAADVAVIDGANFSSWYNQSEGTVFVESRKLSSSALSHHFSLNNGSSSNRIIHQPPGFALYVSDGGVEQARNSNTVYASGDFVKAAIGVAENGFAIVADGTVEGVDNSGTVPAVSQLNIGDNHLNTNQINGHIKRLSYFPTRLPDATLQSITS